MPPAQSVPDWLYVFVSAGNSMAVMNLRITGQYISPVIAEMSTNPAFAAVYRDGSADFLPFVRNQSASMSFVSPFLATTVADYRVEHDAEVTRRTSFRDAPSRLTGIFAFESMDACEAASQRWNWPLQEVQRFKPQHVLRATRVNMEIVSLARFAYRRAALSSQGIADIWNAYWSGADGYTMDLPSVDTTSREIHRAETLWEWLIDGTLVHESRVGSSAT